MLYLSQLQTRLQNTPRCILIGVLILFCLKLPGNISAVTIHDDTPTVLATGIDSSNNDDYVATHHHAIVLPEAAIDGFSEPVLHIPGSSHIAQQTRGPPALLC